MLCRTFSTKFIHDYNTAVPPYVALVSRFTLLFGAAGSIIHCLVIYDVGHSMSSEPNFQHSDSRMILSMIETKTMNSFGDVFKILER
jgi:hypothetical protein